MPTWSRARKEPLKVGHFHLGADIGAEGGDSRRRKSSACCSSRNPVFLVVGTVEPRKGHAQALAAFEQLWAAGMEAELVIVGKQGWMVEKTRRPDARPSRRPASGSTGSQQATDADLNALYNGCSALLAVSLDEGFGLPLIEAAKHALPILARDIPVFREIAGEHAA